MHYTDGESSLRKKTAVEFIMPILMIVVGIVGIYLLLYASWNTKKDGQPPEAAAEKRFYG